MRKHEANVSLLFYLVEEKLGKKSTSNKWQRGKDVESDSTESSDSEEEDDEAELVTEALDSEILATLNAIKSKDPKVYDPDAKFYTTTTLDTAAEAQKKEQQSKPMYLRDYHRENLLNGQGAEDDENQVPKTYAEEQEDLKRSIVKEMHATVDDGASNDKQRGDSEDEDDGFLIRKEKTIGPAKSRPQITEKDIASADKDPEQFLSNFMVSRAWIPSQKPNLQPFESDDEEEEQKAEAFEEAYNFRFEDPNKLNETLVTHARDTISKFTVRREELTGRKKHRDAERQKKEEEKRQRNEERGRLRKLKIEELELKVTKIKMAAGIKGAGNGDKDWTQFLDEGWDDTKWEQEMKERFGDEYYAANEDSNSDTGASKRQKLKKPKWDDDIDITDLVPAFDEADENFSGQEDLQDETKKPKKQMLQEKKEKQREAKRERRKIEQIVDKNLDQEASLLPGSSKKYSGTFRYRESSPVNFGLTARDILMAEDTQLNQFAGLKKLASFRDLEKKRRDNKRLGKKARLRQWRKDTFGDEEGPAVNAPELEASSVSASRFGAEEMDVDIREGGSNKRRKRSKRH